MPRGEKARAGASFHGCGVISVSCSVGGVRLNPCLSSRLDWGKVTVSRSRSVRRRKGNETSACATPIVKIVKAGNFRLENNPCSRFASVSSCLRCRRAQWQVAIDESLARACRPQDPLAGLTCEFIASESQNVSRQFGFSVRSECVVGCQCCLTSADESLNPISCEAH